LELIDLKQTWQLIDIEWSKLLAQQYLLDETTLWHTTLNSKHEFKAFLYDYDGTPS
jgi:hypothetical protein